MQYADGNSFGIFFSGTGGECNDVDYRNAGDGGNGHYATASGHLSVGVK